MIDVLIICAFLAFLTGVVFVGGNILLSIADGA